MDRAMRSERRSYNSSEICFRYSQYFCSEFFIGSQKDLLALHIFELIVPEATLAMTFRKIPSIFKSNARVLRNILFHITESMILIENIKIDK